MKSLFWGIVLIILLGVGGLVYRNAVEHPSQRIVCPLDAKVCPDGTAVSRTGLSCTFPECPPPNVTLPAVGISFAVPEGFASTTVGIDPTIIAAYAASSTATSSIPGRITIRRYAVAASSTPLKTIQDTALNTVSGQQVPVTMFSSTMIGVYRFTIVSIKRFEGVVDTAYYLARGTDVLRFDAIDNAVSGWSDPGLSTSSLPAHAALKKLLATLQVL